MVSVLQRRVEQGLNRPPRCVKGAFHRRSPALIISLDAPFVHKPRQPVQSVDPGLGRTVATHTGIICQHSGEYSLFSTFI